MQDHPDLPADSSDQLRRRFRVIGYGGAVPLVLLAVWLYGIAPDHPWREGTLLLLKTYAAVLLSFLGGARWGVALASAAPDKGAPAIALLPPLAAWVALLTPVPYVFALLAVAFAAQGAWDSLSTHVGGLPPWFGRLRVRLTVVAVASLILALVATV